MIENTTLQWFYTGHQEHAAYKKLQKETKA